MSNASPTESPNQAPTPPGGSAPRRVRKKRRWLKRLAILAVVVVIIGALVNGPIFRWALRSFAPDKLAESGVDVSYQVESGSLWSGVVLTGIAVESSGEGSPVVDASANALTIELNWMAMLFGDMAQPVTLVSLTGASCVVDLLASEPTTTADQVESDRNEADDSPIEVREGMLAAKVSQIFTTVEKFIGPTDINIELVRVEIGFPSGESITVNNTLVTRRPGGDLELSVDSTNIGDLPPMTDFQVVADLNNQQLTLTNFSLGNDVRIPSVRADVISESELIADVDASLFGGSLAARISADHSFSLELTDGAISFDALDAFLEDLTNRRLFLPSGSITKINASGRIDKGHWSEAITADAALALDGFALGKRHLGDIVLIAGMGEGQFTLEKLSVESPAHRLKIANASLPASALESPRPWSRISTESLDLDITDLHEALDQYLVKPGNAMPALAVHIHGTTRPASSDEAWFPAADLSASAKAIPSSVPLSVSLDVESDGTFTSPITWEVGVHSPGQQPDDHPPLKLWGDGSFTIDTLACLGNVAVTITDQAPLNQVMAWAGVESTIDGKVSVDLEATLDSKFGKDSSYAGTVDVKSLALTESESLPEVKASLSAALKKEHAFVKDMQVKVNDLLMVGNAEWSDHRLVIPEIKITHAESKAKFEIVADLPFPLKSIESPEALIESNAPIELAVDLSAGALSDFDPLFRLAGTSTSDLGITSGPIKSSLIVTRETRSDRAPVMDVDIKLSDLRLAGDPINQSIDISVTSHAEKNLDLNATVKYGALTSLAVAGRIPWTPVSWANGDRDITDEALEIDAKIDAIPLEAFSHLADVINELKGTLTLHARMNGSINDPVLSGSSDLRVEVARFDLPVFPGLRDMHLATNLDDNLLTITDGLFESAGGSYQLGGTVDMTQLNDPAFDIQLTSSEALVYRDNTMTVRANADLVFVGSLTESSLSGTVGLVRPLYYKEFNILSSDSTAGAGNPHQLPSFSTTPTTDAQPEQTTEKSFLESCTLDVQVVTEDMARIRTDIATADAVADIHVSGTLSDPQLEGEAKLTNGFAQLPFTRINVVNATATFAPGGGFIPRINVQAQSEVARHQVQIFVSGSASSPQIILTSTPYLPRHEILTLLATGSTRSSLEGGGSAALKAVMLLSQKIAADRERSAMMSWVGSALQFISTIDVNIGETNRLTGKKSHAAEAGLTNRLRFRVEYDEDDSRAALIFQHPLN